MRWWFSILPLVLHAGMAQAQDTIRGLHEGLSFGGTVDQYYVEGAHVTAVSVRGIGLSPNKWTPEIGLGLALDPGEGASLMVADLGTAFNMPLRGAHVLAEGGMTGIFAVQGGGGGLMGAYAGLGVVVRVVGPVALRAGVSRRWFLVSEPIGINVLSIGLTLLRHQPAR
jgi:hypothetical protein